jgi:hypothetical protein
MIGNNIIIVVTHHLYYMQYQRDLQWSRFFVFIQVICDIMKLKINYVDLS